MSRHASTEAKAARTRSSTPVPSGYREQELAGTFGAGAERVGKQSSLGHRFGQVRDWEHGTKTVHSGIDILAATKSIVQSVAWQLPFLSRSRNHLVDGRNTE